MPEDISKKRARELCEHMGRVHMGMRVICLPAGTAGYACALMLESVIKNAGHRVGRLTSAAGFDARESIFIDSAVPSITEFNKAVAELRAAAQRIEEPCCREEATFALGLLLFRLYDCDYVILQGMSDYNYSLDSICAPYELIVMPTVYDESEKGLARLKSLCEAVRRGTREVVSGNQKSEIYNMISNACAMSGVRLYIPIKAQFEVVETTPRRLRFSYCGKEGYSLRSPSHILRNAAMTVIECALALRRGGVKLPWSSIIAGLEQVSGMGGFEMISASPLIISDFASNRREAELLLQTADELWGKLERLTVCVGGEEYELDELLLAFADRELCRIVTVGQDGASVENVTCCKTPEEASGVLLEQEDIPICCLGGVTFAAEMKAAIFKKFGI